MRRMTGGPVLLLLILTLLAGCGGASSGVDAADTRTPPAPTAGLSPAATSSPTPPGPTVTTTLAPTLVPNATPAPSATPAPAATAGQAATAEEDAGPLTGERLVAALRGGGYVIYFRHAATQPSPDDQVPVDLTDCTTQRNLSAKGREQSVAIGEAIRRLEIPIGDVLTSPFCRSRQTAELAFGQAQDEPGIENLETAKDEAERVARIETLHRLLSTPPRSGTNTAIVAHGNILNATARATVVEAGAAIFRPGGDGRFTLVATLAPDEWAALAGGS